MAIQTFQEKPTLGERWGTGLGQGLQLLAEQKMGQLKARQQRTRTQQGVELIQSGIPENIPRGISLLPKDLQSEVAKGIRMQGQAQNLQQRLAALSGGGQETPGQEPPQDVFTFGSAPISEKGVMEVERARQENVKARQEFLKEARKDSKDKWEFNKERYDENLKQSKLVKEHAASYKAQRRLAESGKLTNPSMYSFLKKVGLDQFAAFLNPASEAYLKITQDFVKNIKDVFGARITDRQIEEFLKALPTLQNTDEGKTLILDFLMLKGEATSARAQTMRDIIKEYGGTPPYQLGGLMDERSTAIYEDLGNKFLEVADRAVQMASGITQQFKPGQAVSTQSLKGLPEGSVVKKGDKRYVIRNGKPVPIKKK